MKNDQDFTEELGHSMPSSKRETEEDMLEELCSLAKKDARITIPEICGRMEMTRREVLAYLKQLSARGYVKTEEKSTSVSKAVDTSAEKNAPPSWKPSPVSGICKASLAFEEDAHRRNMWQAKDMQQIRNSSTTGMQAYHEKTDLQYYYEPGDYHLHSGHLLHMVKKMPED